MPERASNFYFDTVVLSNFTLSGRLDLLIGRYGTQAQITPAVLDEVMDGVVAGYDALREIEAAVTAAKLGNTTTLTPAERDIYGKLLRILAPGEASCIACAKVRGGIVVTDDRAARECCIENGLKFTGTIGILKACCRDGALTPQEADGVLQTMIQAGYFSPVRSISGLL